MATRKETEIEPAIFDGNDASLSYREFLSSLITSENNHDIDTILPSRLYGNALRYYESLDEDCQQDFERVRSALEQQFPGGVDNSRKTTPQEGLACLSPQTSGVSPPLSRIAYQKDVASRESDADDTYARQARQRSIALNLRDIQKSLNSSLTSLNFRKKKAPLRPRDFILHCLVIDEDERGVWPMPPKTVRVAELWLNDKAARKKAKTTPLLVVSSERAANLRVGFAYSVLAGSKAIDVRHAVLEPARLQVECGGEASGSRHVSPEAVRIETVSVSSFLREWNERVIRPGYYVTESWMKVRDFHDFRKPYPDTEAVTWILEVI